jgi:hypothetical protein
VQGIGLTLCLKINPEGIYFYWFHVTHEEIEAMAGELLQIPPSVNAKPGLKPKNHSKAQVTLKINSKDHSAT